MLYASFQKTRLRESANGGVTRRHGKPASLHGYAVKGGSAVASCASAAGTRICSVPSQCGSGECVGAEIRRLSLRRQASLLVFRHRAAS